MSMRRGLALSLVVSAALAACGPAAPPAKPWVKEDQCRWWLSGEDGKSLRASIESGSDGIALTIADPVFKIWSESERPKVELRFNKDDARRASAEGWVSLGGGSAAMFGLFLDAAALKAMGEATLLELSRDGKTVVTLPLAATPSAAELEACIPKPSEYPSDSE